MGAAATEHPLVAHLAKGDGAATRIEARDTLVTEGGPHGTGDACRLVTRDHRGDEEGARPHDNSLTHATTRAGDEAGWHLADADCTAAFADCLLGIYEHRTLAG